MISRQLITGATYLVAVTHAFDAIVMLSNCDKVTPGMLMAAGRLNIPTIIVTDGTLVSATWGKRAALARQAERQIMTLADLDIRPRDIKTGEAFQPDNHACDMGVALARNAQRG